MALCLILAMQVTLLLCTSDAYYVRRTEYNKHGLEENTWIGHMTRDQLRQEYGIIETNSDRLDRDTQTHKQITSSISEVGEKTYEWSQWGSTSDCSRSCGIGVKYRKRYCYKTSNLVTSMTSDHLCAGKDRKYQLCNKQACPVKVDDFRDVQCQGYNHMLYMGKQHQWAAFHFNGHDTSHFRQCQLVCTTINKPYSITTKFSNRVIDGTPCNKANVQGVCIDGKCQLIGCDMKFGSNAISDICGVCGGYNDTCDVKTGTINRTIDMGYNTVLNIPIKASNIEIKLEQTNDAAIALKSNQGYYDITYKEGNSATPSSKQFAGTTFIYHGPENNVNGKLWSTQPTNDTVDLILVTTHFKTLIVISYTYTIPKRGSNKVSYPYSSQGHSYMDDTKNNIYHKKISQAININRTIKYAKPSSKNSTSKYIFVENNQIAKLAKGKLLDTNKNNLYGAGVSRQWTFRPKSNNYGHEAVNIGPSNHPEKNTNQVVTSTIQNTLNDIYDVTATTGFYSWRKDLAACSQICNPSGSELGFAKCYDSYNKEVENSLCDQRTKPKTSLLDCSNNICEPRWVATRWSHCTSSCGEGYQYRNIRCWRILSPGLDSTVQNEMCSNLDKPITIRKCKNIDCGVKPTWIISAWSQCSAACGTGTQTRVVTCDAGPNRCDQLTKPNTSQTCHMDCKDKVQWVVSKWTVCPGECLLQHRSVGCRSRNGSYIDDGYCVMAQRPAGTQLCGRGDCPTAWVPHGWRQCSVKCGEGTIFRQLSCGLVKEGTFVHLPDINCIHLQRPHSAASCRGTNCPGTYVGRWYAGNWSQCSRSCGEGIRTRHISCYHDNQISNQCDPNTRPHGQENCSNSDCRKEVAKRACIDDPRVSSCNLVVEHNLCTHYYYKKACCQSCSTNNRN